MAPDAPTPDPSPHSRACGWRAHPHGPECSTNCPTCGSDKRNVRNNMDPRRIHPDWCEDTWHDAPATPAAPGSSSPDTAALVAELRGPSGLASTSRAKHLTVGVCAVAADALEAQASRITELRNAILDIDAHATPFGTDDDGFVSGGYLISVGSLHRALGVVGHSAAKCGGCRNCRTLDQWKAEEQLLRDELEAQATRITELERWKAEALVVLGQWDEVWEALGRPGPLGSSKAVEALTEAHRLRATDPPADVHPRHPRQETP